MSESEVECHHCGEHDPWKTLENFTPGHHSPPDWLRKRIVGRCSRVETQELTARTTPSPRWGLNLYGYTYDNGSVGVYPVCGISSTERDCRMYAASLNAEIHQLSS